VHGVGLQHIIYIIHHTSYIIHHISYTISRTLHDSFDLLHRCPYKRLYEPSPCSAKHILYIDMYVCMCVCMCMCILMCVCICMCMYATYLSIDVCTRVKTIGRYVYQIQYNTSNSELPLHFIIILIILIIIIIIVIIVIVIIAYGLQPN
jgi:hypothetical protein